MSKSRRSDPNADRPVRRPRSMIRRDQRLFYVAVEGESTEPDYLSYLNREFGEERRFRINPLSKANGMKPLEVVQEAKKEFADVASDSQFWALFDRDQHSGIPAAFAAARNAGVHVAFSSPSFELWLLLHFVSFTGRQSGRSNIVSEKLRQQTGYEKFGVREKRLSPVRLDGLRGQERRATRNAKKLTDDCQGSPSCTAKAGHVSGCEPWRRDPSTDVWKLLQALGILDD